MHTARYRQIESPSRVINGLGPLYFNNFTNATCSGIPKHLRLLLVSPRLFSDRLCARSSIASSFLSPAIRDGSTCEGSRICSVRACVVLDRARSLKGSAGVDESVSVDGEGAVTRALDDGRGKATETSGESLDVCAAGSAGARSCRVGRL